MKEKLGSTKDESGDVIDQDAFRGLIRAAVTLNESSGRAPKERRKGA